MLITPGTPKDLGDSLPSHKFSASARGMFLRSDLHHLFDRFGRSIFLYVSSPGNSLHPNSGFASK